MTIQNFQLMPLSQTAVQIFNSTIPPYTKCFSESEDYQHCLENTNSCAPTVHVLYESQSNLVLKSYSMHPLWKAVDKVKESGYVIDAVTCIPKTNTTDSDNAFDLLVVLSPNTSHYLPK